jgi:hypothetical protein
MDDEGIQNLSHLYFNASGSNDALISASNLGLSYNVPSNDKHLFQINGVLVGEWSNSSLIVSNSLSVNGVTVLGNSFTDGIFTFGTWRSSILMGDEETIRCGDSGTGRYIGIHVSNNTDMGSKGTLEGPYDSSTAFPSSQTTLNNLFGDENGSIGVYADTNGTTGYKGRFYYKAYGDWYMVTGSKV